MADHSFDAVSKVDLQEVRNAFGQAEKEIATRYDLKRVDAKITQQEDAIVAESGDEFTLGQALDVLRAKLVKRGIQPKSLRLGKVEPASGGRVRQKVEFQQGVPTETCKKIAAEIKRLKLKVQASIQGDSVRVSGKNKDDLQTAIAALKTLEIDVPLTFTNFR